ncbi:MAG: SMP-30/gluconolactonase/LRE family protein, partial [Nostoc sp.]
MLGWIAPRANAALLVGSYNNNSVLRYEEKTGEFIDEFVPNGSGGLQGTTGLTIGPDNNLYVSSILNGSIQRYDGKTGNFISTFVPSGSGGLDAPED